MLIDFLAKNLWRVIEKMDKKRLSAQKHAEGVVILTDIAYIDDNNNNHLLDIYYPEKCSSPLPVIINVHGGGWAYGNKELMRYHSSNLAKRGFCVVALNYTLVSKGNRYPAPLVEISKALDFIVDNREKYKFDINNLFIIGDSAGAQLSVVTLALQHNKELAEKYGLRTHAKLKAGGLSCGVYDFRFYKGLKGFIVKQYSKTVLGKKGLKEEVASIFSIKDVYNGKIAPLYITSSYDDIYKDQTIEFEKFCKENKIEYRYRFWSQGQKNKLIHVFNICFPEYEESVITNDEMCDFVRKFIS